MSPIASREDGKYLSIYLDEDTKELIRQEAAHMSMSMSEFARHLLSKAARRAQVVRLKGIKEVMEGD